MLNARPWVAAFVGTTLISVVPVAVAQNTIQPQSKLETVTITATRTEHSSFEVSGSVSVVDSETMADDQVSNIGDILENLPNVSIGSGPRAISESVVIRGISDERILITIDGARQNFEAGHKGRVFLDPDLLKQVDVLRGPASALWGSGTIGGVIALTTKDASDLLLPGRDFGVRLKNGYQGVNGESLLGASLYGRATDDIEYLFNITHRESDDLALGGGETLEHSAAESNAGLVKLSWFADDNQSLRLTLQSYDEEGEIPFNSANAISRSNALIDRTTEQRNITFNYEYDDPDNPRLQMAATLYRNATHIVENRVENPRNDVTDLDTLGLDLRNTMHFGDRSSTNQAAMSQTITYGLDHYRDTADASRDGVARPQFPNADAQVTGLYFQNEITLAKAWTLIPGLRYDRYKSQSDAAVADDIDESELSKQLGLSWLLNDWASLHAQYGEAFRAPGFSELYASGTHFTCGPGCANVFVPNATLRPEKAANKELGLRLKGRDLLSIGDETRFKLTWFKNDVEDFIDSVVDFNPFTGGTTTNANITNAELKGIELEFSYDAMHYFSQFSYGKTRGKNVGSGNELVSIPADQWVVHLGWRSKAQGLRMGWRTTFTSDQDKVPEGTGTTDSYNVHDLYTSWQPITGKWSGLNLNFGIDNISDKKYRRHLSVINEPGRNVKVALAYTF